MTRYTNLGRKRTYLEAGFSNEDALDAQGEISSATTPGLDDDPKKKQKRSKSKSKSTIKGSPIDPSNTLREEDGISENGPDKGEHVKKAKGVKSKMKIARRDAASRSEARRLKRIRMKFADTVCFACREKGHAAKDCPNVKQGEGGDRSKEKAAVGICYQCGSTKHTLSRCKKPKDPLDPLPFASCFVCSEKGHLASSCPKNKGKGIYPNGGCCKLCNETSHLARDCPLRKQPANNVILAGTGREAGADEDDFHTIKRKVAEVDKQERTESRAMKKLDVKTGAMSKITKSFASVPPATAKKRVVFF